VKVNRISLIDPDEKEKIKKDGLKLWRSKMNEFAALKQCIEKQHPTDEVVLEQVLTKEEVDYLFNERQETALITEKQKLGELDIFPTGKRKRNKRKENKVAPIKRESRTGSMKIRKEDEDIGWNNM